jgi:hypothetical protein
MTRQLAAPLTPSIAPHTDPATATAVRREIEGLMVAVESVATAVEALPDAERRALATGLREAGVRLLDVAWVCEGRG